MKLCILSLIERTRRPLKKVEEIRVVDTGFDEPVHHTYDEVSPDETDTGLDRPTGELISGDEVSPIVTGVGGKLQVRIIIYDGRTLDESLEHIFVIIEDSGVDDVINILHFVRPGCISSSREVLIFVSFSGTKIGDIFDLISHLALYSSRYPVFFALNPRDEGLYYFHL